MPSVDPSARPVYHPPPSPSIAGVPMPPRGGDHAPGDHSPVPPGGSPPPPRGGYPYGPPPPTYGMPPGYDKPSGPPPPGSYPGSAAGHYGPPPMHHRGPHPHPPPPPPYATGGYPPYGYGRPPPWAGMYEGGFGGGYPPPPSQQRPMPLPSKGSGRSGPPPHPHDASSPYLSKGKDEDGSPPKGDPSSGRMHHHQLPRLGSPVSKPLMISPQEMADNLEDLERTKAQAAAELSLAEVKPIQTDYHFFVQNKKKQLRALAIAEVDQSLRGKDTEFICKNRRFLINSNLNSRLMKEWEELSREEREVFFQKEEEDRRRFMEDDEVASRHCFTLTARVRSPIKKPEDRKLVLQERHHYEAHDVGGVGSMMHHDTTVDHDDDDIDDDDGDMDRLPSPPLPSHGVEDAHNHDEPDGSPGKRSHITDYDGSPTKKNRPEEGDDIVEL